MKTSQLLGLGASLLVAFDLWAAAQWWKLQETVQLSTEGLQRATRLAAEIHALRAKPRQVDETARTGESLAQQIEAAATQAGLSHDRVVHVAPGAPRRLPDSAYLEQATQIELRDVTLAQLIQLSLLVSSSPSGCVPALTVRVPPQIKTEDGGTVETWNAQVTLTTYQYEPTIPPARK